jgi:hypothetical protein
MLAGQLMCLGIRCADADIWKSPGSDMYRPGCDRSVSNLGGIFCLTPIGVLFSLVFTYTGFICLIAGAVVVDKSWCCAYEVVG